MKFEWDEAKNQTNIAKHGIDFNYAVSVFLDEDRIEWHDTRRNYGETRFITIGAINDIVYTIVYTMRKERFRLISARGARRDEKETYYSYVKE